MGLTDEREKDGYFVPASLVNKLIIAIFGSLVAVGGYMIVWAINDARWKAGQDANISGLRDEIGNLEQDIEDIDERFDEYPPFWLTQQVEKNSEEIQRHEREEH